MGNEIRYGVAILDESFMFEFHVLFLLFTIILLYILAKPLEMGYIAIESTDLGGLTRAYIMRVIIGSVLVIVLSIAISIEIGLLIYSATPVVDLIESILFSIKMHIILATWSIITAVFLSLLLRNFAAASIICVIISWILLLFDINLDSFRSPLDVHILALGVLLNGYNVIVQVLGLIIMIGLSVLLITRLEV